MEMFGMRFIHKVVWTFQNYCPKQIDVNIYT